MDARSNNEARWKRHGNLRKVFLGLTLVLLVGALVVPPAYKIPFLLPAMGCFTLMAWHQVLYRKGVRERSASASPAAQ